MEKPDDIKSIIKDRRVKVTPEQREEIVRRRAAGERLIALAEEFGITRQRVDMIAKRQKQATPRTAARRPLNEEQLAWLDKKLKGSHLRHRIDTVQKMVFDKFSVRMAVEAHTLWLLDRGVSFSNSETTVSFGPDFTEYLNSERASQIREREARWIEEQKKLKPKLGRPKLNAEPPTPTDSKPSDPDLSGSDDESEEEWIGESLSIDEMLASVEQTRRKIAGKSGAAPLGTKKPLFKAPGVRVGKHAKATQPTKKKKRKKR